MTREEAIKELMDIISELLVDKLSRSPAATALRLIRARYALMNKDERMVEFMAQDVVPPLGARDDVENE